MPRIRRLRAIPLLSAGPLFLVQLGAVGCAPEVNCENLCQRTLACEVSFAPSDDIQGDKVKSGERTDLESCALGCGENPAVTVESAQCVDEITNKTSDPVQCQAPVLDCFGADVVGS